MEEWENSQVHLIYSDEAISFSKYPVFYFNLTRKFIITVSDPRDELNLSEYKKAAKIPAAKVLTHWCGNRRITTQNSLLLLT